MDLLDVNVLVYAHRHDAVRHIEYQGYLQSLIDSANPFGVPEIALSGFIRVATHPRIFSPPTPPADAILFAEQVESRANCRLVLPGPNHWSIFIDLCRRGNARGQLVTDAYLAALAIESNCELVTADQGFGRWPGLKWRHPLDA